MMRNTIILLVALSVALIGCGTEEEGVDQTADVGSDAAMEGAPSDDIGVLDVEEGPMACNGHPELCERRLDEVVFATTHNAMSNEAEGWIGPNQEFGLTRQLEDGIRAMMLDTHYDGDDNGLFLCHGLCQLGSLPLVEGLGELDAFLRANPNEVLVLIVQDGISSEDTERAFVDSGLIDFVYTPSGAGWPTLGAMIDGGRRLVVTAEGDRPPPEWYLHAWDAIFDTPYNFQDPSEFSCDLNRGQTSNGLFLINHWITKVVPRADFADQVNTFDALHGRATECMRVHDRLPNFVAVDFYATGDLFEVVDALNGF